MEDEINVIVPVELDLLSAVENIVDLAQNSRFSLEFFDQVNCYTDYMGDRLELTKEQCVLLALFIDRSCSCKIETMDIIEYTGCRTTRIIRYINDIEELVRRGFIICSHTNMGNCYRVPTAVVNAFRKNEAYTQKSCSGLTCNELFDEFAEIDGSAIDADGCSGLQSFHFKAKFFQLFGDAVTGHFAHPSSRKMLFTDMNQTVQEGAIGEDDGLAFDGTSHCRSDTFYLIADNQ